MLSGQTGSKLAGRRLLPNSARFGFDPLVHNVGDSPPHLDSPAANRSTRIEADITISSFSFTFVAVLQSEQETEIKGTDCRT